MSRCAYLIEWGAFSGLIEDATTVALHARDFRLGPVCGQCGDSSRLSRNIKGKSQRWMLTQ